MKRRNAPSAAPQCRCAAAIPTTHSGGTKEMAIATPANESAISSRVAIKAPAAPEARAVRRAISPGEMREMISLLVSNEIRISGSRRVSNAASTTTTITPPNTKASASSVRRSEPITTAAVVAIIGCISGATIMAPITVADESEISP